MPPQDEGTVVLGAGLAEGFLVVGESGELLRLRAGDELREDTEQRRHGDEVVGGMVREGQWLREIADNLTVKVPLTVDGIKATKILSDEGIAVNVTLCFSSGQALLAAKAGATFISPFVGRLDDIGLEGMNLIQDIRLIYDNYGFDTEILTASARHVPHLLEAARLGSDVITAPPKVFWQLFEHPMTDKGLAAFLADWEKTGQKLG